MKKNNYYNKYQEELSATNGIFTDICQLYNESKMIDNYPINNIPDIDIRNYLKTNSLIYGASSIKHVECLDGKPSYFITYNIIFNVGSSRNPDDPVGIAHTNNEQCDYTQCNFFSDFFICHPSSVTINQCDGSENVCGKIWCEYCLGNFYDASNLVKIMHRTIKFSNIPKYSVIYLEKQVIPINHNNIDDLFYVKKFLENDRKKLSILQHRINNTEEKIKLMIQRMNDEKECNIKILNKMLSTRGGSIDKYDLMINGYNQLIKQLNDKIPEKIIW